jgi:ankyrin repeat protein
VDQLGYELLDLLTKSPLNETGALALIDDNANLEVKDVTGTYALHMAARGGSTALVAALIAKKGAIIDAKDSSEHTALYEACAAGQLDVVKLLLTHTDPETIIDPKINTLVNEDIDFREDYPDIYTAVNEHFHTLKRKLGTPQQSGSSKLLIMSASASAIPLPVRTFPLHDACKTKSLENIKAVLQDRPRHITNFNADGYLPVHLAAERGLTSVVQYLLDRSPDTLTQRRNNGSANNGSANTLLPDTLLHCAARSGNAEAPQLIAYLIQKNVFDINEANNSKNTPLMIAISNNMIRNAKALIRNGAVIDMGAVALAQSKKINFYSHIIAGLPNEASLKATLDGILIQLDNPTLKRARELEMSPVPGASDGQPASKKLKLSPPFF